MTVSVHQAVMLAEVVSNLNLDKGKNIIDCTFGAGGHSKAIYEQISPAGKLLVIDADKETFVREEQFLKNKDIIAVNDNFKNLKKIVKENFDHKVDGILADLGFSSDQIENSGRGFSFLRGSEKLDMRFDPYAQTVTASEILNTYQKSDLAYIFKEYGDYSLAEQLSSEIAKQRKEKPFETAFDLIDLVLNIDKKRGKKHPATQVFQALRIEVNQELRVIQDFLPQAVDILSSGGRLAVITFHSLEDRIVKNYFKEESRKENSDINLITKKALRPSYQDIQKNRRSRSAYLRVIEKK
jgi:16S rRNA (cytosine1402-N4)-methyltransferase